MVRDAAMSGSSKTSIADVRRRGRSGPETDECLGTAAAPPSARAVRRRSSRCSLPSRPARRAGAAASGAGATAALAAWRSGGSAAAAACTLRRGGFKAGQRLEGRARLGRRVRPSAPPRLRPMPELAAVLVDDAEVHEQVRRQLVELEVGALARRAAVLGRARSSAARRPASRPMCDGLAVRRRLGDELGQRHQPRARPLVQALQQRVHLVLQHAGHQPFAALVAAPGSARTSGTVTVTPSFGSPGSCR